MLDLFQIVISLIALPFLAVVAFAFNVVKAGLRVAFTLAGWELAWPPVLVDDLELETSNQLRSRSVRGTGRQRCLSR